MWRPLTGAFSYKSAPSSGLAVQEWTTVLLDASSSYAVYDAFRGVASAFQQIRFANFPVNVRGAIRVNADDTKLFLFTPNRVYLYKIGSPGNEVVENDRPLSEWLKC
ncbi:unnamed protein product, partial [Mesorhabditis belari]|uniref:Uncharacterized protein n=1 Tax=Mesorhabditis belari TaxID=2138241 RepID=A0AAF3ERU1_9BILA